MSLVDFIRTFLIIAIAVAAVLVYTTDYADADPNLTQFTSKDTRIAVGPAYVTWLVLK